MIEDLTSAVDEFINFAVELPPTEAAAFNGTVARMHKLCELIDQCYLCGSDRPQIMQALSPILKIYEQSPFVNRLQTWPRGYPGDFESRVPMYAAQPLRTAFGSVLH